MAAAVAAAVAVAVMSPVPVPVVAPSVSVRPSSALVVRWQTRGSNTARSPSDVCTAAAAIKVSQHREQRYFKRKLLASHETPPKKLKKKKKTNEPKPRYGDFQVALFGSIAVVILSVVNGMVFSHLVSVKALIEFSEQAVISNYALNGRECVELFSSQ